MCIIELRKVKRPGVNVMRMNDCLSFIGGGWIFSNDTDIIDKCTIVKLERILNQNLVILLSLKIPNFNFLTTSMFRFLPDFDTALMHLHSSNFHLRYLLTISMMKRSYTAPNGVIKVRFMPSTINQYLTGN